VISGYLQLNWSSAYECRAAERVAQRDFGILTAEYVRVRYDVGMRRYNKHLSGDYAVAPLERSTYFRNGAFCCDCFATYHDRPSLTDIFCADVRDQRWFYRNFLAYKTVTTQPGLIFEFIYFYTRWKRIVLTKKYCWQVSRRNRLNIDRSAFHFAHIARIRRSDTK